MIKYLLFILVLSNICYGQNRQFSKELKTVKDVKAYLLQNKEIEDIEGLWKIEYVNNSIIKERGIETKMAEFTTYGHVLIVSLNGELKMFQVGIGGKLNDYDKIYYEREKTFTVNETFGHFERTSQKFTYLLYSSTFSGEYEIKIKIKDNEFQYITEFEKKVTNSNYISSINRYNFNFLKLFPN